MYKLLTAGEASREVFRLMPYTVAANGETADGRTRTAQPVQEARMTSGFPVRNSTAGVCIAR
jgi:hypothetical protein